MDVFRYANWAEQNWEANLAEMSGYERKYTFYNDFSIAEFCECRGVDKGAIKDTYKRVVASWGKNIKAITEVSLVLNHKICSFYDYVDGKVLGITKERSLEVAKIYDELWHKVVNYIETTYADDEQALAYYYEVTD